MNEIITNQEPVKTIPSFTFYSGGENNNWVIRIDKNGIFFNREFYPNVTPDSFAQAFIDILEMNYDVTFTKRKKQD